MCMCSVSGEPAFRLRTVTYFCTSYLCKPKTGTMLRSLRKKHMICVCVVSIILYLLLRTKTEHVSFQTTIHNSKPIDIWEYVADFSNMKSLNPTILDFDIKSESGNYDHWRYSVEYTEFLSHLPYIHNTAQAEFNVKPGISGSYLIQSTHSTCFVSKFACLTSYSEFWFEPLENGTKCTEQVTYECPFAFTRFCYKEVMYQRNAIMANLKKQFSSIFIPRNHLPAIQK